VVASALLLTLLIGGAAETGGEIGARIALHDDAVRIADIAIAPAGENRIVARLPRRASGVALTEAQRRSLLRGRVPGGQFRLRHTGTIWLARGAVTTPAYVLRGPCYTARTDLPAGSYLDRDAVAETECRAATAERRLGYDAAARVAVARDTIPAGAYLGRLRLIDRAPVAPGQAMTLRTSVGPVIVDRTVTSLQPGRHGKRLFVRTDDGKLLASTLASMREPTRAATGAEPQSEEND
jgi:hypothetical protein